MLAYLNCLSLVMRVSNKWRNSFRSFSGCLFDKWVMLWELFVFGEGFVDLHNIRFQVLKDGLVGLETSTRSPEIISISTSTTHHCFKKTDSPYKKKKKNRFPLSDYCLSFISIGARLSWGEFKLKLSWFRQTSIEDRCWIKSKFPTLYPFVVVRLEFDITLSGGESGLSERIIGRGSGWIGTSWLLSWKIPFEFEKVVKLKGINLVPEIVPISSVEWYVLIPVNTGVPFWIYRYFLYL